MAELQVDYARVSTRDQNLDFQREVLDAAGCDEPHVIALDRVIQKSGQVVTSPRLLREEHLGCTGVDKLFSLLDLACAGGHPTGRP